MSTSTIPDPVYPSLTHSECPYPFYDAIRAEGGVYEVPGSGDFLITRWETISYVTRHPEIFSSALAPYLPMRVVNPDVDPHDQTATRMLFTDPPLHAVKRKIAGTAFKPSKLKHYEPMIQSIADALIDGFPQRGEIEFKEDFATPLPVLVISHILGLPEEDAPRFTAWGNQNESFGAKYLPPDHLKKEMAPGPEIRRYVEAALRERYEEPRDDALSDLLRDHEAEHGDINWNQVIADGAMLLIGGLVTTSHWLTSTMVLLQQHPEELRRIREDHSRIPAMLEESLRVESPVQWQPRVAAVDTELEGKHIPAGSLVLMLLGSANRDVARFGCPADFDPTRTNVKEHLAFSRGVHTCLGSPLARLEGKIAMDTLLRRLKTIELVEGKNDFTHIESIHMRAPKAVYLNIEKA